MKYEPEVLYSVEGEERSLILSGADFVYGGDELLETVKKYYSIQQA